MTEQTQPENAYKALPVDANHPDDQEIVPADDVEVDALIKNVDPSAPVLYGEGED